MEKGKAREWWIYTHDEYGNLYAVDRDQRGFRPEAVFKAWHVREVIPLTDEEKRRLEEARKYARQAAQDHAQFLLSLLERAGLCD